MKEQRLPRSLGDSLLFFARQVNIFYSPDRISRIWQAALATEVPGP
jgi:hypothetical protein